ncbi:MAG: hypothetical protein HKN23_06255 [Verrucomicrobiales bacterium]|nr:hypothetical protein [Verrucomicrobiales bacterium]
MKTKLTLTVEKDLIEQAKTIAHAQDTSVSSLVESFLSGLILKRKESFSQRWQGSFKQAPQPGRIGPASSLHR